MRPLLIVLIIALISLQHKLWLGDGNILQWMTLEKKLTLQQDENNQLISRNKTLETEIKALQETLRGSEIQLEQRVAKKYLERMDLMGIELAEAGKKIGDLSALEAENSRLKAEMKSLKEGFETAGAEFAARLSESRRRVGELSALEEAVVRVRHEKENLSAEIEDLKQALEDQKRALKKTEMQAAEAPVLSDKVRELKQEAQTREDALIEAQTRISSMSARLNQLEKIRVEYESLQKELDGSGIPFMNLYEAAKKNTAAEREKYEQLLRAKEAEISDLRELLGMRNRPPRP